MLNNLSEIGLNVAIIGDWGLTPPSTKSLNDVFGCHLNGAMVKEPGLASRKTPILTSSTLLWLSCRTYYHMFFLKAKLTAGPPAGVSQDSWKSPAQDSSADIAGDSRGWEFPDLLVTSEALAAEMLSESTMMTSSGSRHIGPHGESSRAGGVAGGGEGQYHRLSAMPIPPPPEFSLSTEDVDQHRFVAVEQA